MRNRCRQLNMPHTLTTHTRLCDFYTTFFTYNATVFEPLIFTAKTLIIFDRPKDFGTKQAVTLWLKSTIVDRFRFFNFTKRPRTNHIRGSKTNTDAIKIIHTILRFEHIDEFFHKKTCLRCLFLFQINVNSESLNFFGEYVERLRHAWVNLQIAINDVFVHFGTTFDIIGLYRQHFLQGISGTVGL